MMGRKRGQVVDKMKIRLPEFQNLFNVVSMEVDRWVKKNCDNCRSWGECWSHEGAVGTRRILECKKHTPLTKAYFEMKFEVGLRFTLCPLAIERPIRQETIPASAKTKRQNRTFKTFVKKKRKEKK